MDRVNIRAVLFVVAVFMICLAGNSFPGLIGSSKTADAAELMYSTASQSGSARGELSFSYQYFPELQVYYDPAREVYFYQDGGKWVKSPALPITMRNRLGDFVLLHINVENPYEVHAQVKEHYPPKPLEISEKTVGSPPLRLSEAGDEIYRYQYYPASEVYFDPARRLFFYNIDGRWEKSSDPPATFRTRPSDFTIVEMKTPNPFEFHSQVKQIDLVETERLSAESPDPPSWQPAASDPVYEYRYYPAASVYFDVNRNVYFHQSKGQWIESQALPEDIANKLGPSAVLHMNSSTPYVYHSEVTQRYPHLAGRQLETSVYAIWKEGFGVPQKIVCHELPDIHNEMSARTVSPGLQLYCQRSEVHIIEAPMEVRP